MRYAVIHLFFAVCLLLFVRPVSGQLLKESFAYPVNQALTSVPWKEHSGSGNNPVRLLDANLSGKSGSGNCIQLKGSGQDVSRGFSSVQKGGIFVSFLVNVHEASAEGDYFFHLGKTEMGTAFTARVFVRAEGEMIRFGVSKSSASGVYSESLFERNKTYHLVLHYEFLEETGTDDEVKLYLAADPGRPLAESLAGEQDSPEIGTVALRQGAGNKAPELLLDEIRIAESWQEVTDLTEKPFLSLSHGSDLYAFNSDCGFQPVFNYALSALQDADKLILSSSSRFPVMFSADGVNWEDELEFSEENGAYASSFYVKTAAIPGNIDQIEMLVKDENGKERRRISEPIRVYQLRRDCTLPIAQARTFPAAAKVKVGGRITAASGQFPGFNYLQDSSGGIRIEGDFGFMEGDSVQFTGKLSQVFQEPVLVWDSLHAPVKYDNRQMQPVSATLSSLSQFEGQLITLNAVSLSDKRYIFLPDANEVLSGNGGKGLMRVWWSTGLPGHLKLRESFSLTGVVARFRDQLQIYPRKPEDLTGIGPVWQDSTLLSKDITFDLLTWNLEWFGSTSNGPADEELQQRNAASVLNEVRPDLAVLEEITDTTAFQRLTESLSGYEGMCSSAVSGGGDPEYAQRVCFMYRKETVEKVSLRPLLAGTPPIADYPGGPDRFWASGRFPALFTCDVRTGNGQKRLHVVGIHAKANRNSQDREQIHQMRKTDIGVLKDTLDTYFSNVNLIMAGDFNDDVDETVVSGLKISTYAAFSDDWKNYRILTRDLSDLGYKSYIGYDNVIDHVLISDELADHVVPQGTQLLPAFQTIPDYPSTTSDHLPVISRFYLQEDARVLQPLKTFSAGEKEFELDLPEGLRVRTEITSGTGKKTETYSGNSDTLSRMLRKQVKKLDYGDYLLQVFIGNSVKTYKIVKR